MIFVFEGFFFQSDRPTQNQEGHSTLNEKKRGMTYSRVLRVLTREITALVQAISEFCSLQIKFYSSLFLVSFRYDNI